MSSASPSAPRLPRVVVVGPTATGKSALALDLAEKIQTDEPETRAEIINADASLLYRGMDIGTAKPSPAERARVPHHQIDVLTVRDRASVAAFQRSARGDIDAVESRGHLPIIAGGSGLYVRALTDDLDFPGTDPAVRTRLSERAEQEGTAALHAELARLDPAAAAFFHARRPQWEAAAKRCKLKTQDICDALYAIVLGAFLEYAAAEHTKSGAAVSLHLDLPAVLNTGHLP